MKAKLLTAFFLVTTLSAYAYENKVSITIEHADPHSYQEIALKGDNGRDHTLRCIPGHPYSSTYIVIGAERGSAAIVQRKDGVMRVKDYEECQKLEKLLKASTANNEKVTITAKDEEIVEVIVHK